MTVGPDDERTGEIPRIDMPRNDPRSDTPRSDTPRSDTPRSDTPRHDSRPSDRSWIFDQRPSPVERPAGRRAAEQPTHSPYRVPSSYERRTEQYPYEFAPGYADTRSRRRMPWWRTSIRRNTFAVVGAFAMVFALGGAGWALLRPTKSAPVAAPPSLTPSESAAPTLAPEPTPTPTPSPSQKTVAPVRTANPVPVAPPTTHPPVQERPPAPQPQPTPTPGCTPTYSGTNASMTAVRDALVAAGGKQYWQGVQPPADLQGPLPVITVPANLMKAVAWQESGWQSAIVSCDGGIGTMQLMPGTVTQVNNRFGTNYDPRTLSGNTALGATYIEWLIMYFGLYYYGQNFDLSLSAPIGTGGTKLSLLEVVVSAYNVGPAALENADNTLSIPNQQYVDNVIALMTTCPCLSY